MSTETVSLDFLRRISNLLFDYLESEGLHSFPIEKDYYWMVAARDRYDPYKKPDDLLLGQLYDDYETLTKLENRKLEPIMYHLTVLAAILNFIGDTQAQLKKE